MVINHNISALNTYNKLSTNETNAQNSLEKLSSGLRINKAADDAAGLAISQKMQAQINGLDQASSNAQSGISLIQTAEGGMNQIQTILQRMNDLATQSANGTQDNDGGTDRTALDTEFQSLGQEIDRIANSTQFNGKNLLDGTVGGLQLDTKTADSTLLGIAGVTGVSVKGLTADTWTVDASDATKIASGGGVTLTAASLPGDNTAGTITYVGSGVDSGKSITVTVNDAYTAAAIKSQAIKVNAGTGSIALQVGANNSANDQESVTVGDMRITSGSLSQLVALASANVSTQANAQTAITTVQGAIDAVSSQRAQLGAYQNRLNYTISNLSTESQNLTAASSQITDVDMAKEMTQYTKNNILTQAAEAMLAQANQLPQGVLSLLKS